LHVPMTEEQRAIREGVAAVCARFGDDYWRQHDRQKSFPVEFVDAMVKAGWTGATLPQEYGGAGLGIREAALILYEINRTGGAAATASVLLNLFGPHPVVRFGSEELKRRTLPRLITGEDRTCLAVTEADVGLNTTDIKTFARREGDRYIVNGRKAWVTTAQIANKILLVTRTTAKADCAKPTDGITLFYTDMDRSKITVREIEKMGRHAVDASDMVIEGLEIPVEDRIGEEGKGFKYLLHGLNAERIVVAAGMLGGTRSVLDRAVQYAKDRVVFGRPIGKNQAIQHPLAEIWARLTAAELTVWAAATLYDAEQPCAAEVNASKFLSAELYFDACTRAVRVHGGYGQAKEYHVERYFRECTSALVAPVSQEMVLCHIAEQMLGLPKSY